MELLDPLLLARWQFGLTTLYHYLFVPLTLGLALVTAIFQTVWYRTGDVKWLHLTRFFGKIFLINFAMGVVTGIVQEFQFGMNWSSYSRFVGDVFGAPLAFEGLLAFFLEATFIGLWIFGWDKLPRLAHLASIWMAAIGATLSAYFILAANAFMQNPVGYEMAADGSRAELVDFWALLTNPVALAAFPHTITSAWMFAAAVLIAVSAWHLMRHQNVETMRTSLRFGMWFMVISFVGVAISGDQLSIVMTATQPMKMAAAEAMYDSACGADASFSLFSIGTPDGSEEIWSLRVPYLLSLLSTHSLDGCVEGINDLQALYNEQFGPGDYTPIIWITYWSFRWMMGLGGIAALLSVAGLWVTRKKSTFQMKPWMWRVFVWSAPLPLLGSLVGWVFTEMGRQPWIVFSLMLTEDGVSPSVPGWNVLVSLIAFTAIYATLAVVELGLIIKYAQKGPDPLPDPDAPAEPDSVENTPTTVY
ncbi:MULTISPECIES: cytochrome ubiquinol oxidase subunit I [Microbacterium]|uniref:Cytochrome ubiquinol oxidase subunit I n=1 Tax=Microbacterium wangchenii TaxID=2541726 RepID=A0ABX5SXW4_9MICO|nr:MULTISPECIES: cytochrome ubiquinol oxidase subunit I [Microbacterium]MCK6067388.1 cytochrome ubiquinol oxidase subunit I [Microbacterium sp. EYE_512]QBR89674.1 cytochrome ubiquinol oxidase subunit I [Microbacterium wangchenii]TXK16728.1 cytochrome ubiquinol oxidase subunit I [Microbacterium wangchenii]